MIPQVVIMKPKKYDVVYVDPPWSYTDFGSASATKHYKLMSQQALGALDIKSILNKKGLLLMWATGPRLDFAIDLIRAWGLHYRGVGFVWVKTRGDGKIINGQGVPPTFTKPTTEYVLVATTQRAGRPVKLLKHNTPQVVLAPRRGHSTKPEEVRKLIEATIGTNLSMLEIFARTQVAGWDAIGDALTGEDVAVSIGKLNGSIPCVVQPVVQPVQEADSTSTGESTHTETPTSEVPG